MCRLPLGWCGRVVKQLGNRLGSYVDEQPIRASASAPLLQVDDGHLGATFVVAEVPGRSSAPTAFKLHPAVNFKSCHCMFHSAPSNSHATHLMQRLGRGRQCLSSYGSCTAVFTFTTCGSFYRAQSTTIACGSMNEAGSYVDAQNAAYWGCRAACGPQGLADYCTEDLTVCNAYKDPGTTCSTDNECRYSRPHPVTHVSPLCTLA